MKQRQNTTTLAIAIRAVLSGLPLAMLCITTNASYAATVQTISISNSTLDKALQQLAIQTGSTLSYDANRLAKLQSPQLQGQYSVEQALQLLLEPHQLRWVRLNNGGYSIQPIPNHANQIVQLETINLTAQQKNAAQSNAVTTDSDVAALPTITLSARSALTTEGTGLYTAQATTASNGLALSLKQTPQLVSVLTRQQMEDQNISLLTEVASQTAGLSLNQVGTAGTDSSHIYARGKKVDNYLLDGVKLLNSYSSIFQSQDMALFDRVEVVRGANGLMTGAGSASASMNMVRKKPFEDLKASVTLSAGSWDKYRSEVDVSSPLNAEGTVRGRMVLAYQTANSYIDRADEERKIAYAVVEADLTPQTKASLGASFQQIYLHGIASRGLPSYYQDGALIDWSRSRSAAADWTYSDRSTTAYFADIEHHFNERWSLKGVVSRTITDSDEVVGYAYNTDGVERETGKGVIMYATRWVYKPTQDLFNLTLNGSFDLWNQSHDIVMGTTYSKSESQRPSYSGWNNNFTWDSHIDDIFSWDGRRPARPETMISGWYGTNEHNLSAFSTVRFKIIDPLAVILGARVENWDRKISSYDQKTDQLDIKKLKETGKVTPYFGITYDLTDHWTAYASYTNIFAPQNYKNEAGDYLDPLLGNSTELGIKGEFFDNQLNIGAAIYQTKEDNLAVAITDVKAPDGSQAYRAESGSKSRGFEVEATGKISNAWQISSSFSRNLSEDNKGDSLNSQIPKNTAKLFSTYQLPYFDDALTIGAGVRWQSQIYNDNQGPFKTRFTQGSYALVDLMARYKVSDSLVLNLNVNNLFNEKYYLTAGNSYYGAPTNFNVALKYNW
ncbi:TonB-dependent siderophore receptor [Acinetobacter larvae]|uniref:TonB-dependent receptor n=1 Tax=Acinetobacter larvae TaxID=1789224 RepID=A0A1B2M471_9GAMM|nr:TonB-dependent receptor [Acinetobacter larvae]AOA59941.1 TonB-dependent receptor [Acinetobacter larvae]